MQKRFARYFDNIIMILIVVSSVLLAIDSPLNDPQSFEVRILFILNAFFTLAFTIEAIIKIIALGFFYTSIKKQ